MDRSDRTEQRTVDTERLRAEARADKQRKDPTRPPQEQQRRAVAHRVTVGTDGGPAGASAQQVQKKIEDTLPPAGEPEYTEDEVGTGLGILPVLIVVGLAVIAVLVYLLLRQG